MSCKKTKELNMFERREAGQAGHGKTQLSPVAHGVHGLLHHHRLILGVVLSCDGAYNHPRSARDGPPSFANHPLGQTVGMSARDVL